MRGARALASLCVAVAVALAVPIGSTGAANDDEAYPGDITPPPGTQYPCALTALPRALTGVPESERDYIERVYGLVIRGIHAKLLVLKAVEGSETIALGTALARYQAPTEGVVSRISALPPPAGRMQARYPQWSRETSESVYHHLCALDLF